MRFSFRIRPKWASLKAHECRSRQRQEAICDDSPGIRIQIHWHLQPTTRVGCRCSGDFGGIGHDDAMTAPSAE